MKQFLLVLAFTISFLACNKQDAIDDDDSTWLIPVNEVRDGGPGKDGIPSIDNPDFKPVVQIDYMEEDDLIIGVKVGDEIKGYTHEVLDWHEIVNDELGGVSYALTYCPLTGTALAWNREIDGEITTFGVSGLLYNSNLMPYDRKTDSNWSQLTISSVSGTLAGANANIIPVIETNWKTWKDLYPGSDVISTETGFNRNYGTYPYGDYKTSSNLIFPVSREDNTFHHKDRVLGLLIDETVRIYSFDDFIETSFIQEEINGVPYVIFGDRSKGYMAAFINDLQGERTFENSPDPFRLAKDDLGNAYDIFGTVKEGSNRGESLILANGLIGYWFSFPPFYSAENISFYQ